MDFIAGIIGAFLAAIIFLFGVIVGWIVYDRDQLKKEKTNV